MKVANAIRGRVVHRPNKAAKLALKPFVFAMPAETSIVMVCVTKGRRPAQGVQSSLSVLKHGRTGIRSRTAWCPAKLLRQQMSEQAVERIEQEKGKSICITEDK